MQKTIVLEDDVKDEQGVTAQMRVVLTGDGSTPEVMTRGEKVLAGYNDDGSPLYQQVDENALQSAQQKFMAAAIKEQKQLTADNGGDPSKVNIIGAEAVQKAKPTAQQTLTAGMLKDIAMLKIQVAQIAKEDKDNGQSN